MTRRQCVPPERWPAATTRGRGTPAQPPRAPTVPSCSLPRSAGRRTGPPTCRSPSMRSAGRSRRSTGAAHRRRRSRPVRRSAGRDGPQPGMRHPRHLVLAPSVSPFEVSTLLARLDVPGAVRVGSYDSAVAPVTIFPAQTAQLRRTKEHVAGPPDLERRTGPDPRATVRGLLLGALAPGMVLWLAIAGIGLLLTGPRSEERST